MHQRNTEREGLEEVTDDTLDVKIKNFSKFISNNKLKIQYIQRKKKSCLRNIVFKLHKSKR